MPTDSGMTPEYARFIARLFQRVQAKGAEIRRERQETSTNDREYLEYYEGALISVLLLMKSQAEIARFALGRLGMAALDPKRKGWGDSVFESMPLADATSSGEADALFTPAEYLQTLRKLLRDFARDARESLEQGVNAVANKTYAQALDDVADVLEEERVRAGLDEHFEAQK